MDVLGAAGVEVDLAEIRELREITRDRRRLVKARTSVKDRVRGVLAKPGIPAAGA